MTTKEMYKTKQKATKKAIELKATRKTNPVASLNQLAREFGLHMAGTDSSGPSAPKWFKQHVMTVAGKKTYMKIRDNAQVRS